MLSTMNVCDILGISPNTVKALIQRGELPAVRIGYHYKFRKADIEAYIARQTINGDASIKTEDIKTKSDMTVAELRRLNQISRR